MTTVLDHTTEATALTSDLAPPAAEAPAAHTGPVPRTAPELPEADILDASGFNEAGLRPLTGHDYLIASVWGIAGAIATTAVAVLFLPVHLLSLTLVLGAGLGVLGYLDHVSQLIRNKHNLFFGISAALLLGATQVISGGPVLIPAAIAAAAAFAFMLALTVFTGFAGGGDIKLSPIPAALLAAVSPIAAMLWLLLTFVLCLVGMIGARVVGSKRRHVAMAPFMAVAAVAAIGAYGLLANALGL